jgi:TolA-binding protein
MPEENATPAPGATGNAAPGAQPPAQTPGESTATNPPIQSAPLQTQPQPPPESAGSFKTVAEAEAEIKRLRTESAANRTRAKALADRLAAHNIPVDENSETARLSAELAQIRTQQEQAQAQLQQERINRAVTSAASGAYLLYPDMFLAAYGGQIKLDKKTGEPENLKDLIADARKKYPRIFNVPSADGGAHNQNGSGQVEAYGPSRLRQAYANSTHKQE